MTRLSRPVLTVLAFAAYTVVAVLSIELSRQPGSMASVWYANAVGVVAVLLIGGNRYVTLAAMLLANLTANLILGNAVLQAALFLPGNGLEMLLGVVLLAPVVAGSTRNAKALGRALVRGVLVPVLVASVVGALLVSPSLAHPDLLTTWLLWAEGDLIGAVSVLPFGLALLDRGAGTVGRDLRDPESGGLILLAVAAAALSVLYLPFPFFYLSLLPYLLALRARYTATTVSLMAISLALVALIGLGFLTAPATGVQFEHLGLYTPLLLALAIPPFVAVTAESDRRARAELEAGNEALARQAHRDHLTGLANRLTLEERLDEIAGHLGNRGVSVGVLDLDNFKEINDTYGHRTGDKVLAVVAARVAAALRPADVVYRAGGDEFVLLFGETMTEPATVADRLLASAAQPVSVDGVLVPVSASLGLAHAEQPARVREVMALADARMYEAKKRGRNCAVIE